MGRAIRVLRGAGMLAVKLLTSPRQGARSLTAALESMRMRFTRDGIFRRAADLSLASSCPRLMIDKALELWSPRSIVDVGCGTGQSLAHWVSRGVEDAVGLEGSQVAIDASSCGDRIRRTDLSKPVDLGRKFDLVYCVEVAEHIHPNFADTFVDTLASLGRRVLMTAAHPGQGGLGHLNEQPREYWAAKFQSRGFRRDTAAEVQIQSLRDQYWENVLVFERPEA